VTWKRGDSPVGGRKYGGTVLTTDREQLAYAIRCDARYTRDWIGNYTNRPDDPSFPHTIRAAERFVAWCATANDELLADPNSDPAAVEDVWRREAVISNVVAVPYDIVTALTSPVLAVFGLLCVLVGSWAVAIGALVGAGALMIYRVKARPRLVVGPDARRGALVTMTLNDLRNSLR
jgi:hypothetical protein